MDGADSELNTGAVFRQVGANNGSPSSIFDYPTNRELRRVAIELHLLEARRHHAFS